MTPPFVSRLVVARGLKAGNGEAIGHLVIDGDARRGLAHGGRRDRLWRMNLFVTGEE